MDKIYLILFVAILVLYGLRKEIIKAIKKSLKGEKKKTNLDIGTLSKMYYKTSVLTKAEAAFYSILKSKCDNAGLSICPKVRLEDFIRVRNGEDKQSYRGRIKSRHVDFLICDNYLNPICGVELDDKSHEVSKAKETDNFKNNLYTAIGLKLYRVKTGTNYETEINSIINEISTKENHQ